MRNKYYKKLTKRKNMITLIIIGGVFLSAAIAIGTLGYSMDNIDEAQTDHE